MATVQYYDGNQGIYAYTNLGYFDATTATVTSFRAEYNGNGGGYSPQEHAYAIELVFNGAATYTNGTGPIAGEQSYTDGTITGLNFFDNVGNLLISVSDLSVDLASFTSLFYTGRFNLWEWLTGKGNTYIGSNDSMNIADDWNGDDISTSEGKDKVKANGGDDYIKDYGGADKYSGGDGFDTLSYDEWVWNPDAMKSGIVADLNKGTVTGPDGLVDKISGIESIRGTFLVDKFVGDGADNSFMGYQGRDVFNGKGGFDRVSYRNDDRQGGLDGIIANLTDGTVRDGFGHFDKLKGIEGVEGTSYEDSFTDSARDDWFRGRGGDDTYRLSGGNDYVHDWDDGADRFEFLGNFGTDTIGGFDKDSGDRDILAIEGVTGMGDLNIWQDGSNTVIEAANGTIILEDFDATDLAGSDFDFSGTLFV